MKIKVWLGAYTFVADDLGREVGLVYAQAFNCLLQAVARELGKAIAIFLELRWHLNESSFAAGEHKHVILIFLTGVRLAIGKPFLTKRFVSGLEFFVKRLIFLNELFPKRFTKNINQKAYWSGGRL